MFSDNDTKIVLYVLCTLISLMFFSACMHNINMSTMEKGNYCKKSGVFEIVLEKCK